MSKYDENHIRKTEGNNIDTNFLLIKYNTMLIHLKLVKNKHEKQFALIFFRTKFWFISGKL